MYTALFTSCKKTSILTSTSQLQANAYLCMFTIPTFAKMSGSCIRIKANLYNSRRQLNVYPLHHFCLSLFLQVVSLFESPLHNLHVSRGGKMVPYAGWSLPTVYDDLNIFQSVLHTRKHLSLFDVSHMMQVSGTHITVMYSDTWIPMLQVEVSGNDAEQFLETILVSDLQKLKKGHGKQSSND